MKISSILLRSGESLTANEVYEAVLLLARAEADFPVLSGQDAHLCVLMLVSSIMAYNDEEKVI